MKKVLLFSLVGGMFALASCGGGPSAEDKAAAEQAKLDSIKAVEQAEADAAAAAAYEAGKAAATQTTTTTTTVVTEEVVEEPVKEEPAKTEGGKLKVKDEEKSGKGKLDVTGKKTEEKSESGKKGKLKVND